MLDPVMSERDAADILNVSPRTLQRLRESGGGPTYVRIGERRIGYRLSDLNEWLDGCRRTSRAHEYALQTSDL